MEHLINKLIDMGMGHLMDKSRDELTGSDETYQSDTKAESDLEQRYLDLDLTENQRMITNDYIACMRTANGRYSDLSYMAGIKDTVTLFIYLGLLKDIEALN